MLTGVKVKIVNIYCTALRLVLYSIKAGLRFKVQHVDFEVKLESFLGNILQHSLEYSMYYAGEYN